MTETWDLALQEGVAHTDAVEECMIKGPTEGVRVDDRDWRTISAVSSHTQSL